MPKFDPNRLRHMVRLAQKVRQFYWFIRRPQTTGARAIVINKNGEVLLVKHTYQPGWYLPGGGIKRHESPDEGIARELREEAGVLISNACFFGSYINNREYKKDTVLLYTAILEAEMPVRSVEISNTAWFLLGNLPRDTSPATVRRLMEYQTGKPSSNLW